MEIQCKFRFTVVGDIENWDSGTPFEVAAEVKKLIENAGYGDKVVEFEHTPYFDEPDHFISALDW